MGVTCGCPSARAPRTRRPPSPRPQSGPPNRRTARCTTRTCRSTLVGRWGLRRPTERGARARRTPRQVRRRRSPCSPQCPCAGSYSRHIDASSRVIDAFPDRAQDHDAMNDKEWLAERFEANRSHLRGVAYRMLGSVTEADDAVQEAWIRLARTDANDVDNLRAWLTTVVGRVCLNMLRSRKTRRETSLETHLPDPIVSPEEGIDPEQEALLGDSVGLAMLVVLDSLTPAERVAFVLHDVFAVPFDA